MYKVPKWLNEYIENPNTEHYCIFGLTDIFVFVYSSSLPFYTINPSEYLPDKCINVTFQSILMSFSTVF